MIWLCDGTRVSAKESITILSYTMTKNGEVINSFLIAKIQRRNVEGV